MKLETQERTVRRSGEIAEGTFRIAANAKAFDILSSKLYTNTRLAIVRELSTNAWDAQKEAGNANCPFEVHLPNTFAPFFRIRDFGTGLSPEAVATIYTTYFASTRTDSNDFVGALGLGSKSPFSYTDQFTITSYWNGVAYSYSAFKNERGEPSLAVLGEEATTERNGVEIRINIREGDAAEFVAAAQRVYRFFPVKPTITGSRIEFPAVEPRFKGYGYMVFDQGASSAGLPGRVNVVMGNICYPVAMQHFQHLLGDNAAVVLFCEIGECEVAASREELHYSEDTKKNIQARLDKSLAEVNGLIEAELGKHLCLVEKIKALRHYRGIMQFAYASQSIPIEVAKAYSLKRIELRGEKLYIGRDRWQHELDPRAETNYVIVENDMGDEELKQSDKNRLRHFLHSQRGMFYFAKIEDRAKFEETFGKVAAVLSTLPDAPKSARVGYTGPRSYIKTARHGRSRATADHWSLIETADIDVNDAIAVPRKGTYAMINGREVSGSEALEIAQHMGYKRVYGIAQAYYARIRGELKLLDLEEEAKEFAQQAVDAMDEFVRAKMQHGFDEYSMPMAFIKWIRGQSPICDQLYGMATAKPVDHKTTNMITMFSITVPQAPDFRDAFKASYPLLSQVELRSVNKDDVIEYIVLKS